MKRINYVGIILSPLIVNFVLYLILDNTLGNVFKKICRMETSNALKKILEVQYVYLRFKMHIRVLNLF